MDKSEILEGIEPGLKQYQQIMERFYLVDVSTDKEFQRIFNGFYRMRQRPKDYYTYYFHLMESCKNKNKNFEFIFRSIYENTGRCEASFSSKMLATLSPEKPIWDKYVLENLNFKVPNSTDRNRIEKVISLYNQIDIWYKNYLLLDESEENIMAFDNMYPNTGFTNTKKIDFILWQSR